MCPAVMEAQLQSAKEGLVDFVEGARQLMDMAQEEAHEEFQIMLGMRLLARLEDNLAAKAVLKQHREACMEMHFCCLSSEVLAAAVCRFPLHQLVRLEGAVEARFLLRRPKRLRFKVRLFLTAVTVEILQEISIISPDQAVAAAGQSDW